MIKLHDFLRRLGNTVRDIARAVEVFEQLARLVITRTADTAMADIRRSVDGAIVALIRRNDGMASLNGIAVTANRARSLTLLQRNIIDEQSSVLRAFSINFLLTQKRQNVLLHCNKST